ncbi:MAG: right-handed parallel beta-helix repeat-containing protein [Planctomycetota bacterium]
MVGLRNGVVLVACCALVLTGVMVAGPLDPPPGPVEQTDLVRTEADARIPLTQASAPGDASALFRITAPGSYYLTRGVSSSVAGQAGVSIETSNVTLDLNGYTLSGAPGTGDGVRIASGLIGVTVRDGFVRGWGGSGVAIAQNSGGVLIEGVTASSNLGSGFDAGSAATIRHCSAVTNAQSGFRLSNDGVVESCEARANGVSGFIGGGTFRECVAFDHADDGFSVAFGLLDRCRAAGNTTGFELGSVLAPSIPSRVDATGCVSERSGNACFVARGEVVMTGCTSHGSLANGVLMFEDGGRLIDCVVTRPASTGISTNGASVIDGCSVHGAGGFGLWVLPTSSGAVVTGTRVVGPGTDAFLLSGSNVTLRDCVATDPGGDGIAVASSALIERCAVHSPGDNGVELAASSAGVVISETSVYDAASCGFRARGTNAEIIGCRAIAGAVGFGVDANADASIRGSLASGFSSTGFDVLGGSGVITGNTARGAGDGFILVSGLRSGVVISGTGVVDDLSPYANFEIFVPTP